MPADILVGFQCEGDGMKNISRFLKLCHQTWPTPPDIHHAITLVDDDLLVVSIHSGPIQWHQFSFSEDLLADPASLVERIKRSIEADALKNNVWARAA